MKRRWRSHWRGRRAVTGFMQWRRQIHMSSPWRGTSGVPGGAGQFDLLLPDGMPLIWCINRFSKATLRTGSMAPPSCSACWRLPRKIFSFSARAASEELLEALQKTLGEKFPDIRIAGAYSPPFGEWPEEEDEPDHRAHRGIEAQFVWVGLGCPKQELWIARNKSKLPPAVYTPL